MAINIVDLSQRSVDMGIVPSIPQAVVPVWRAESPAAFNRPIADTPRGRLRVGNPASHIIEANWEDEEEVEAQVHDNLSRVPRPEFGDHNIRLLSYYKFKEGEDPRITANRRLVISDMMSQEEARITIFFYNILIYT